jgi:hypothetical protein
MSEPSRALVLALVGNRLFPRYAIVMDSGREAPVLYWTRRAEGPWSPDPQEATRWADPEVAAAVLGELRPDVERDPRIGCR